MAKHEGTPEMMAKRAAMRRQGIDPEHFLVQKWEEEGLLTLEQADAGIRLYFWHYKATGQEVRALDYQSERIQGVAGDVSDRFTVACKYFKTMSYIRAEEQRSGLQIGNILRAACIDEWSLNAIRKQYINKRHDQARQVLAQCFDTLLDAMQAVREADDNLKEGKFTPPAKPIKSIIKDFSHL